MGVLGNNLTDPWHYGTISQISNIAFFFFIFSISKIGRYDGSGKDDACRTRCDICGTKV